MQKNAVFYLSPPTLQNSEFFTIASVLTSTLMVSTENAAIRRLYIGLRVRYKYYKKMVVLVWPADHVPITF